jgi:hypothetical protein
MADENYGSYGQRMFFELVGPRLERFVEAHNLKLEKWFKDVALWRWSSGTRVEERPRCL